jgi:hypothetical protein
VLARLVLQALLRLEHVTVRSPSMRCSARNLSFAEVLRRPLAVFRREVELGRRFVVQSGGGVARIRQFQTLTSR